MNDYYGFLAERILDCNIEELDAAFRDMTGHGIITTCKKRLGIKGNNLKFKRFNLIRFAQKDLVEYIGKAVAHDGAPTQIYRIECQRTADGRGVATVMRNEDYLFDIHAKSFHIVQHLAIQALHAYVNKTHRRRKNRHNAKKNGGGGKSLRSSRRHRRRFKRSFHQSTNN
jgi:hypothetical protein